MTTAIVVIDMVRDFCDSNGRLSCGQAARDIIGPVADRINSARQRGDMVIYLCDHHPPDDSEFRMFPPHCIQGTPGSEVIPELTPHPGDVVIAKRRFSAFFGTDLEITLAERGIKELELAGVCTNICVLYTAADARMRGFDVTVHRNAVASFDSAAHEFALSEMERTLGVRVV